MNAERAVSLQVHPPIPNKMAHPPRSGIDQQAPGSDSSGVCAPNPRIKCPPDPRSVDHGFGVLGAYSWSTSHVARLVRNRKAPSMSDAAAAALAGRDDLINSYGHGHARLLFVAQLLLGVDDIDSFAADALTDGANDKTCDLVAVMRDEGIIVIAQSYEAANPDSKKAAPANKSSSLNGAVSWLLSGDLDQVPMKLRSAAEEARDAISSGDIRELQVWYVHNLPESENVKKELDQVVKTGGSLLADNYPDSGINIAASEIGQDALEDAYRRIKKAILVADSIEFQVPGGFRTTGESWEAYNTAIKASDLRNLWRDYSTDLLSLNVRDYLGVRKSEQNINNGIKNTARETPSDFMIYNNGITAIVHSFEVTPSDETKECTIRVQGIGIANGGQTTGALGELSQEDSKNLDSALVQIRFVATTDDKTMDNLVLFNNTQNKLEAADFRSNDAVQDQLRQEFEDIPEATYKGGRRGGDVDAIKRERDDLPIGSVAQSVVAFHGWPNLAYNERRKIWAEDSTYAQFFNDSLHARHVVFCLSLLKSIEKAKRNIMQVAEIDRTKQQTGHASFFSSRGSVVLLTAAIGNSMETIIGRRIRNQFSLEFNKNLTPTDASRMWDPVVASALAFSNQLLLATDQGLKSQDRVTKSLGLFASMIEATRSSNTSMLDKFAAGVYSQ